MATSQLAAEAAKIFVRDALAEVLACASSDIALDKTIAENGADSLDEAEFVIALEEQPARDVAGEVRVADIIAIPEEYVDKLRHQPLQAWVDYMHERLATKMEEESTRVR